MNHRVYVVGLVTLLSSMFVACSGDADSSKRKRFSAQGAFEYTTVDVEAASADGRTASGLSLTSAPIKTMKLKVSCDGIPEEVVEDDQFELPVGARNCKAKLVSLNVGDKTYVEPANGSGFEHYLKKDTGKFVNEKDPNDFIYLTVKKSLPSPLVPNSTVEYQFSAVDQFETIDASTAEVDSEIKVLSSESPKLKAISAMIGQYRGLNIIVQCTAGAGFVGNDVKSLVCGDQKLSEMKFAVAVREEGELNSDQLRQIMATAPARLATALAGSKYLVESKQLHLNFGRVEPGDVKTRVFIASLGTGASTGYSYGFIRLKNAKTHGMAECPEQGNRPNFIEDQVRLKDGVGVWTDTSNCWNWMRVETKKVASGKRDDECVIEKQGSKTHQLSLPFFGELRDARNRNIHVLAKGAAPKLGANVDQETFWTAGGRVFNMKDGTVRKANVGEVHGVLCVIRKD